MPYNSEPDEGNTDTITNHRQGTRSDSGKGSRKRAKGRKPQFPSSSSMAKRSMTKPKRKKKEDVRMMGYMMQRNGHGAL